MMEDESKHEGNVKDHAAKRDAEVNEVSMPSQSDGWK